MTTAETPITEELLDQLGFLEETAAGAWILESQSAVTGYPTRIHLRRNYYGRLCVVFLEQAEYIGERSEGIGDADWTWEYPAGCIHLQIPSAEALESLVGIVFGEVRPIA